MTDQKTLKAGSMVVLESTQSYNSNDLTAGQTINARTKYNVVAEKQNLITAGSMSSIQVIDSKKGGLFGSPGQLEIQVISTTAVDSQQVLLSGMPIRISGEDKRVLVWIVCFLVACVTLGLGFLIGLFWKGKPAELRAGHSFNANVASDMEINI
jgi:hypothetical protein